MKWNIKTGRFLSSAWRAEGKPKKEKSSIKNQRFGRHASNIAVGWIVWFCPNPTEHMNLFWIWLALVFSKLRVQIQLSASYLDSNQFQVLFLFLQVRFKYKWFLKISSEFFFFFLSFQMKTLHLKENSFSLIKKKDIIREMTDSMLLF